MSIFEQTGRTGRHASGFELVDWDGEAGADGHDDDYDYYYHYY